MAFPAWPPTDTVFLSQVGPIEATSFTLRAVRTHARYCIQVAAQDLTDYGQPSNWSLPATATAALGQEQGLSRPLPLPATYSKADGT